MTETNTLQPGDQLQNGKYLITQVLGQGLFGITYLAMQIRLDKKVIVKEFFVKGWNQRGESCQVLCEESARSIIENFRLIYFKEAKLLAQCSDNKRIVDVHDTFQENQTVYLVTEYIFEDDLSSILHSTDDKKLDVERSISIISQVAEGMEALHEKGLLHLDLSPGKVLLSKKGEAVIIDPGINVTHIPDEILEDKNILFKKGFSAPEMQEKGAMPGPQCDIYSMGALLYFMLTGTVPEEAALRKSNDLSELKKLSRGLNPRIIRVIEKAMALHTGERYARVTDFIKDLEGAQKHQNVFASKGAVGIYIGIALCLILSASIYKFYPFHDEEQITDDPHFKVSEITVQGGAQRGTVLLKLPGTGDTLYSGVYYALIIGVENYENTAFATLENPIDDAARVYKVLTQQYTFDTANVTFLKDPTESEIINALSTLKSKLTETDNLFIFFAGHGKYDQTQEQGFLIPSGAQDLSDYISFSTLKGQFLEKIKARHILFVTDACQSGSIFRGQDTLPASKLDNMTLIQFKERSVHAFTSANFNPVPDKSDFIKAIVGSLEENRNIALLGCDLFISTREKLRQMNKKIDPARWGELRECGSNGGDFLFIRRSNKTQ